MKIFLFLILLYNLINKIKTENKFKLCDLNSDLLISKVELNSCLKFSVLNNNKKESIENIFNLFDVDQNNQLDLNEFELFLKISLDNERDIEIITKDGIKKNIKQGEFLKLEEEQRKGFQYENGQVSKVNEGELNLNDIKNENPDLSRFITIGKWAHYQIKQLGYATGNITGIKSLNISSTNSNEDDEDEDNENNEIFSDDYYEVIYFIYFIIRIISYFLFINHQLKK